jgi:putative YphP/YqiW family bacilliredoxin
MVAPMREDLTRAGIEETRTPEQVEQALARPGTTLVVVNSICGCAAGRMRPAVRLALQHKNQPDHKITVFAGQDREATEQARGHFEGQSPSSPSIALFRDGKLEFFMPRALIEMTNTVEIAQILTQAFDEICAPAQA